MSKTAVIYARVSSSGDRQSTDRQVADLRAFAKREGFEVLEVFAENSNLLQRAEEPYLGAVLRDRGDQGIHCAKAISHAKGIRPVRSAFDSKGICGWNGPGLRTGLRFLGSRAIIWVVLGLFFSSFCSLFSRLLAECSHRIDIKIRQPQFCILNQ